MSHFLKSKIIKVILFFIIGIWLFCIIQHILIPKRYSYQWTSNPQNVVEGLLKSDLDDIDVLFLGTSHMGFGLSPMELYETYKIKSYNSATDVQFIDISYYLLKETLDRFTPSVVVLDASCLFLNYFDMASYRKVLDAAPLSMNKIELISEYSQNEEHGYLRTLVPFYEYHSRWNDLIVNDFADFLFTKNYYSKGYSLESATIGVPISNNWIDEINREAQSMSLDIQQVLEFTENECNQFVYSDSIIYPNIINEHNKNYLNAIKKLCDDNSIKLLLTKIPSAKSPSSYPVAWTKERYTIVKSLAGDYDIDYYDLMYDGHMDLDWTNVSIDGGAHLNIRGATEVSLFLGDYLTQNYDFDYESNPIYENDLSIYKKIRAAAILETELDYSQYLHTINTYSESSISIIISCHNDFSSEACEALLEPLRELGTKISFQDIPNFSYVLILENGQTKFELLSNRLIQYTGQLNNGAVLNVNSAGHYSWFDSFIKINGTDYDLGMPGISLVIYDNDINAIIDSVNFQYDSGTIICNRRSQDATRFCTNYEDQLKWRTNLKY